MLGSESFRGNKETHENENGGVLLSLKDSGLEDEDEVKAPAKSESGKRRPITIQN